MYNQKKVINTFRVSGSTGGEEKLKVSGPMQNTDSFTPWISIGLQLILFILLLIWSLLQKKRTKAGMARLLFSQTERQTDDLKKHMTTQLTQMEQTIQVKSKKINSFNIFRKVINKISFFLTLKLYFQLSALSRLSLTRSLIHMLVIS
jgi:hypothetical protein